MNEPLAVRVAAVRAPLAAKVEGSRRACLTATGATWSTGMARSASSALASGSPGWLRSFRPRGGGGPGPHRRRETGHPVSDSERYALVVALAVGCGAGHGTADPSRRVRRMWTQSTAWRLEIEGQRWMRRWG